MKKILNYLLVTTIATSVFGAVLFEGAHQTQAYDANNLISDGEFTDWQTWDAGGVQAFLNTRGGTRLRTFSEGGQTAAQIIYNASRANHINPIVILATIQKEESIVDSNYNFDYRVVWAMGYGVCDSCSLDDPSVARYRGFTNQINNGTWQLRRNYDYWASFGDWAVGNTMIIDGTAVRFANRATSSLYRYTPHLHGNENFNRIYGDYRNYHPPVSYSATLLKQYPRQNYNLRPGQRQYVSAVYRNTGTAVWSKTGANPTYLGNSSPQDRSSVFTGGNIRWQMIQSVVRRNGSATFAIWFTAPQQAGVYTEKFRPVIEGITWMGDEVTFVFNVGGSSIMTKGSKVSSSTSGPASYAAAYVSQAGLTNLRPGQSQTLYAYFRNSGSTTWYQNGANPAHLGNSSPQDRGSVFTDGENVRWNLLQSTLSIGQVGVFSTTITAPAQSGIYTEKFRPLIEGITWMGDEVTFVFNVGASPGKAAQ